jgi:hypothetical protein
MSVRQPTQAKNVRCNDAQNFCYVKKCTRSTAAAFGFTTATPKQPRLPAGSATAKKPNDDGLDGAHFSIARWQDSPARQALSRLILRAGCLVGKITKARRNRLPWPSLYAVSFSRAGKRACAEVGMSEARAFAFRERALQAHKMAMRSGIPETTQRAWLIIERDWTRMAKREELNDGAFRQVQSALRKLAAEQGPQAPRA